MKYIITLCFLAFTINVSTQPSIKELLAAPFASELVVSPDRSSISWVDNIAGCRNIYFASGSSLQEVSQLTDYHGDEGISLGSIQFTKDGKGIVYVRGNTKNRSGQAANPALLQINTAKTLHHLDIESGGIREIGPGRSPQISPDGETLAYINKGQIWLVVPSDTASLPKELFHVRGSQDNLQWSPNGDRIAFVSYRGDHSFVGVYNIATGKIVFYDPSVDNDYYPVWRPDGNAIAYMRIPNQKNILPFTPHRDGHPWSIRLIDLSDDSVKTIWTADSDSGSVLFGNFPSIKLAWTYHNQLIFPWEKDGWVHLYSLNSITHKTQLLTPGNGIVEDFSMSKDKKSLFYTSNINDPHRRHIWQANLKSFQSTQITSGSGIEFNARETMAGVVVLHTSAQHASRPGIILENRVKSIGSNTVDFTSLRIPDVIEMTADDGYVTNGTLFYPNNYNADQKYPSVIFIHGGSKRQMLQGFHYSGYYSNAFALQQYFASQGYISLSINYRSGIGYGLNFREADAYGVAGGSEVGDLIAAGEYLADRSDVDDERIALWGGSYGGYMTAHGLSRRSDLFAVGVDIHGVHNWNTELPTFAPWYDPSKYPAIAKIAFDSSPEAYLDGWESPVLFIHGDDDRNVPFAETVVLTEQLRDRGVYFEQLIFPDEVHGFLLHKNWVKAQEATFEFINRYIGK